MRVPGGEKALVKLALEYVEICGSSAGQRAAAYQQYSQYVETGRNSGGASLANELYAHCERMSSILYCPSDSDFTIDFEYPHDDRVLGMATQTSRMLSRSFNLKNIDLTFGDAVMQSIPMGASFVKLTGKSGELDLGEGKKISHIESAGAHVIPPWLMGVENEGRCGLDSQEAILETVYLNKHDVWRRIKHLPDAHDLYKRIMSRSSKTGGPQLPASFIQVLSTSQITLQPQGSIPTSPGGVIQTSGDPNFATVGPQTLAELIQMWELWVKNDEIGDWMMIQIIAPDVLIAPRFKRINEFCPGRLPYTLVQPNATPGYFWGRSEITDLMTNQSAMSETLDDFRRLIGVQYDKRLAFTGFEGDPQEMYDDMRNNGWVAGRQGAEVKDLTPSLPAGALEYIKLLRTIMTDVSGFGNILSGQGESGVRAGNHASTLVKTASPRLRKKALRVERQYAACGDAYLAYMEAKDGHQYYFDEKDKENSAFLLDQLPEDRRVVVDSHSASPIYENDNNQLAAFGLKAGIVDGEDAIDMLRYPNKDVLKRKLRAKKAAEAKFLQEHPEALAAKGKPGGKK